MTITLAPPQSEQGYIEQVRMMLSEPQTPTWAEAELSGMWTGGSRPNQRNLFPPC